LLPWVICCVEPLFIGVFVHDHDEAVVPVIWHWIVYETSPTMAVPEGGLMLNSKQWGFHNFFYIWYRLLCMLFEDTNINVHALTVRK
jgi:hypothetical protein